MSTNTINIAEILAKQPRGTKLYSPLCGEVAFDHITEEGNHIICRSRNIPGSGYVGFTSDGRFYDGKGRVASDGECLLFPSKALSQWDVTQFEDGDIIVVKEYDRLREIPKTYLMIFKRCDWRDGIIYFHALMMIGSDEWYGREGLCSVLINPQASKVTCMPACDCEVFEMSKALREHHLRWNAEKKCVEPLPNEERQTAPRFKFEPYDKVLVRDGDNDRWQPAFFSVLKEDSAEKFGVIDGYLPTFYSQCIPYNDDTKHLLGTYDPYKPKA